MVPLLVVGTELRNQNSLLQCPSNTENSVTILEHFITYDFKLHNAPCIFTFLTSNCVNVLLCKFVGWFYKSCPRALSLETQVIFWNELLMWARLGFLNWYLIQHQLRKKVFPLCLYLWRDFISYRRQICLVAPVQHLYIVVSLPIHFQVYYSSYFSLHDSHNIGMLSLIFSELIQLWKYSKLTGKMLKSDLPIYFTLVHERSAWCGCGDRGTSTALGYMTGAEVSCITSLLPVCLTGEAVGQSWWSGGVHSSGSLWLIWPKW